LRYKVLRHIRFAQDSPMTASGKAKKFFMREETVRELGLTVQKAK
jgi:fatty-acyl-CoA synthase